MRTPPFHFRHLVGRASTTVALCEHSDRIRTGSRGVLMNGRAGQGCQHPIFLVTCSLICSLALAPLFVSPASRAQNGAAGPTPAPVTTQSGSKSKVLKTETDLTLI